MPAFSFGTSTAEHSEHASTQSTFGGASSGTSGMFSFKMTPMQPTLQLDNNVSIKGDGLFALKTSASMIAPSKATCNNLQTTSSFSFLPQVVACVKIYAFPQTPELAVDACPRANPCIDSFLPAPCGKASIPSAELQLPSSYSSCDFDEQKPDQHDDQSHPENDESESTNNKAGVAMGQAAADAAGQVPNPHGLHARLVC